MIKYKEQIIPRRKEKVVESVTCDMCGFVTEDTDADYSGEVDWETGYDIAKTCISIREGVSYPEGGHGTKINIHICPECFHNVLVKFLMEKGVKINTTEWES